MESLFFNPEFITYNNTEEKYWPHFPTAEVNLILRVWSPCCLYVCVAFKCWQMGMCVCVRSDIIKPTIWLMCVWWLLLTEAGFLPLRTGDPAPIKSCPSDQRRQHSKVRNNLPQHSPCWELLLTFIEILILMSSFYCTIDLCNGFVTVYPIDSYVGVMDAWCSTQAEVCFYSGW